MSWLMSIWMWNAVGRWRWGPSVSVEFPSSRGRIWSLRGISDSLGEWEDRACADRHLWSLILGLSLALNILLVKSAWVPFMWVLEIPTLLHSNGCQTEGARNCAEDGHGQVYWILPIIPRGSYFYPSHFAVENSDTKRGQERQNFKLAHEKEKQGIGSCT